MHGRVFCMCQLARTCPPCLHQPSLHAQTSSANELFLLFSLNLFLAHLNGNRFNLKAMENKLAVERVWVMRRVKKRTDDTSARAGFGALLKSIKPLYFKYGYNLK